MTPYTVKIKANSNADSVLIYPANDDDFIVEMHGSEAKSVIRSYDLPAMGKKFARAELDENGLLMLGAEIDELDAAE